MWFDGVRQPNTIYVANTSRGKDSTAMLRAIELMGWPLDAIVSVDIWFDDETPAELPPMVAFKDAYDAKVLEKFGVPVTRLCATQREREREREYPTADYSTRTSTQQSMETISRDSQPPSAHGANYSKTNKTDDTPLKLTYLDIFYREIKPRGGAEPYQRVPDHQRELVYIPAQTGGFTDSPASGADGVQENSKGEHNIYGFPYTFVGGWCHQLKNDVMRTFSTEPQNEGQKINIVHYIGIAADEPLRIARHMPKKDKVLPLVQIGWDEDLCGLEAQYMDMLAPTYTDGQLRDGCWFCHNQGVDQLRRLRKNYPDLWAKLMKIDLDSPVTFKSDGHTVHDFDKRFQAEDDGKIQAGDRRFRWKQVLEEPTNQQITFEEII